MDCGLAAELLTIAARSAQTDPDGRLTSVARQLYLNPSSVDPDIM